MTKKIAFTALILSAALLLLSLQGCGEIEYALVSEGNESSDGLVYSLYEDGSASVTGRTGDALELVIPATVDGHKVKSIAARAFEGQTGIVSLKISAGIEKIGEFAFSEVTSLMTADLGQASSIGSCAFYGCSNLTWVRGTEKLKTIGDMAFCGCLSLTGFYLQNKLESLGERAFGHCSSLAFIRLPKSLSYVGPGAFENCASLARVDISNLKSIPDGTFTRCELLAAVDFSSSLTSIGEQAFRNCTSLDTLNLPSSLKSVGDSAFFGCDSLKTVNYAGSEKKWNSVDIADGNTPLTSLRAYCGIKMPDGMTVKAVKAASYVLPGEGEGEGVQDGDFIYKLTPEGKVEITGFAGNAANVKIPAKIGGADVVSIGSGAFLDCKTLETIDLGNVISIGTVAFSGCTSLSRVTASDSLIGIGVNAFMNTPFLDSLSSEEFPVIGGGVLLAYNGSSASVTLPSNVRHVGSGAFAMNGSIVAVDLCQATTVGDQAFAFCESLRFVNAPSLTYVGAYAFCACTGLPALDCSEQLTYIGENAFSDCYKMTYVCLGGVLEELSGPVFSNCQNIRVVRFPATAKRIVSASFSGCMTFVITYPGDVENLKQTFVTDGVVFLEDMFFVSE